MIPFSLIPEKPLFESSKLLFPIGSFLASFFPLLDLWLRQADSDYTPREYASMSFLAAAFNALFLFIGLLIIGFLAKQEILIIAIILPVLMMLFTFVTIVIYPKIIAMRRAKQIEFNLIHAVRQILIELRSGVTLFSAMASVTVDYGEASVEFRKIVNKIESGAPELDVLAEASTGSPSPSMRRLLWQVSNALKVGSDVSAALDSQVEDLTRERIEQIRRYGQELSPWTMMYLLGAVICPSLGVTMLIVLTTFIKAALPSIVFVIILVGLLLFQLFFMNLVSSRRPMI
ncbi:MAG: type II secretion system F family protein [Candidatus Micrarchaeota archaeon]